jgi:predicted alpha/beta-fold hydrolase
MLFRGCDGTVNRARRLYHSGETTDLDFVVRRLIAATPGVQLCLAGVSLGGNVLLKWLGEQGTAVPPEVRRAAAASTPFDLAAGSRNLESPMGQLYVDHFMSSLKAKTRAKRSVYPDLCDWGRLESSRTFWEFDDAVTGPVHGFSGALDYYTKSSSINFLNTIQVPTFLLNAADDPFLPPEVLDLVRKSFIDSEFIHFEFTQRGGHVGWIEGFPFATKYYMEERVINWLNQE